MTYAKGCLTVLAAVILAAFVPSVISAFRSMSQDKAVGLAVIPASMLESIVSPLFWLLAVTFFAMFFATGRLTSSVLRGLLFWFPTLFVSILGVGLLSWFALLMLRLKRS